MKSSTITLPILNPILKEKWDKSIPTFRSVDQTFQPLFSRLCSYTADVLSNFQPWTKLVDRTAFSKPASLSEAALRVRKNAAYFRINYLILLALVFAYFMLSHPLSLLTILLLLGAWFFLYVLQPSDQAVVIFGKTYSDAKTLVGLSLATVIVILVTNVVSLLITTVTTRLAVVCTHGAFRVLEDLFLDNQEAFGFFSMITGNGATFSGATMGGTAMISHV